MAVNFGQHRQQFRCEPVKDGAHVARQIRRIGERRMGADSPLAVQVALHDLAGIELVLEEASCPLRIDAHTLRTRRDIVEDHTFARRVVNRRTGIPLAARDGCGNVQPSLLQREQLAHITGRRAGRCGGAGTEQRHQQQRTERYRMRNVHTGTS